MENEALSVLGEDDGIPESVARNQELELLTQAIQSLPDRCRRIFTLRKVYGLSQADIAQRLGISENTVSASAHDQRQEMHGVHAPLPTRTGGTLNMNPSELDPKVELAAAEWLVQQDRGLSAAQQDSFLQWIAASPAHREAFERHRRMWRDFDALSQWRPKHSAEPNADLLARSRYPRPLRWALPIALAVAAVLVFAFWLPRAAAPGSGALVFEANDYRQEHSPMARYWT